MQRKKLWCYLPAAACALSSGAYLLPAQAVEVRLSGQVNRLIMRVDNGEEDGLVHADNSVSGTRVRIEGMEEMDNGVTVGLLYETQLQSNPSNKITEDSLDSDGIGGNVGDGDYFSTRFATVWFKGSFGKVTLGQGSGASDGTAEVDKSGTTVIQYVGGSNDLLGSMEYGTSGVTVDDARSEFDGLGRNDNLRYDAAKDAFSFAASIGNGDKVELSGGYAVDDFEVRLGLWDAADSGDDVSGYAISASWMSDRGLNLTGAYSGDDRDGDPNNIYLKLGYRVDSSAFGFDWSKTSDLAAGDGSSMSVAWVEDVMQGVQLFATFRVDSLDDVSGEDDITALAGGARVKF